MLRKINSYLSLATTACFVIHASLMCLLLGGAIPYRSWYKIAGIALLVLTVVHTILAMVVLFMNPKESNSGKMYWRSNTATVVQRILAVLILAMMVVHVQSGAKLWVYQVVYIAVASGHIALSLPRAMLTAGAVPSENAYKKFQIFAAALGIAITVWSAISYAMYAMMGS